MRGALLKVVSLRESGEARYSVSLEICCSLIFSPRADAFRAGPAVITTSVVRGEFRQGFFLVKGTRRYGRFGDPARGCPGLGLE
jgi:hypothetical protein